MYKPSIISAESDRQHLVKGLMIGRRFHSAPVIRLADAKPVRLGDATKLTAAGVCSLSLIGRSLRRAPLG
jgi:hypothetical protein